MIEGVKAIIFYLLCRGDPSHWSKECLGLCCQSPKQLLVAAGKGTALSIGTHIIH